MKLVFFGTLRNGCEASSLFCFLEGYGLYYNVDVLSGKITIDGIKPTLRERIISEVNNVFEVSNIKTEKTENDDSVSNPFKDLEESLSNANLNSSVFKYCIANMASEAKLLNKKKNFDIQNGEIITCNFGFGLYSENYGSLNVLVLRPTENDKYLVVPINLRSNTKDKGFCMNIRRNIDATYYNKYYQKKKAVLYLNRIQEVHRSRLSTRIGFATKWFLNSVYERFYSYNYEKPPLHLVIEELLFPSLKGAKDENCDSLNFQCFFKSVKITSNMALLQNAFSKALVNQISSLTCLIPLLQKDNELNLSQYAVKEKLRTEFVTWFDSIFPNIFDDYYRISLSDVLKVFLQCYNELT